MVPQSSPQSNPPEDNTTEPKPRLKRELGLFSITAFGVGAMVGAGVFVLTGIAAGTAGPALILAFIANGVIALIVGSCYGELAAMVPRTGGAYVWARMGLGPVFGFLAGWMSWFAQTFACALYATAFGSFTISLLHTVAGPEIIGERELAPAVSVALLAMLLFINYRGAASAGRVEVLVTGLKVALLTVVVVFGFGAISDAPDPIALYQPFLPEGMMGLVAAMGLTFVAFEGYEVIAQSAEEVADPTRLVPRAILLSIAIAVTIYVFVAVVMLGAVTAPDGGPVYRYLGGLGELALMQATDQFVPHGKLLLLIAGLASAASALNATLYSSSRIAFAMGRDGDLFKMFERIHARHRTPYVSIRATGLVAMAILLALPIKDIAAGTDIMFLLVFVMVAVTVIRLRQSRPDQERPFRVPWSPLLPMIAVASGITLALVLIHVSPTAWTVCAVWLALGAGIYIGRRQHLRRR